MNAAVLLIGGFIAFACGVPIARLGWSGFTRAGMPFNRQRRLTGRVGEVIGQMVLFFAIGFFASGLAAIGTSVLIGYQWQAVLSQERAYEEAVRIAHVNNRLNQLSPGERSELLRSAAAGLGREYSEGEAEEQFDAEMAWAVSEKLDSLEHEVYARAMQEFQERQRQALEEQKRKLAEQQRLLSTGDEALAKLRADLDDNPPGTIAQIASIVDLCEELAIAAAGSGDRERAMDYCREGYRVLQSAIQAEPSNDWYKRRLRGYGYSPIGKMGGADANEIIDLFEGAVRAARFLADSTTNPSDCALAGGLIHNMTMKKTSADYSLQDRIEGYREAIRYERLALIHAYDKTHARSNMEKHVNAISELYYETLDWKALVALASELKDPSNPYLLLFAAQCCSSACSGAKQELDSITASAETESRTNELTALIKDANAEGLELLRQSVAAGLTREELEESLYYLTALADSPEFASIVESLEGDQSSTPPSR